MMNTAHEKVMGEITALKSLLNDSDHKSNKLIEGLVATMKDATPLNFITKFIAWLADAITEYGADVEMRESYRVRIRELELELEALENADTENEGDDAATPPDENEPAEPVEDTETEE